MEVTGLFHVAIKTNDLDATVKFYTDVLGMKLVHRPDFGFPGAWIAAGDNVPIVHIYAGGPALVDGKAEGRPVPEIPADRVYQAGKPFGKPKQKAA